MPFKNVCTSSVALLVLLSKGIKSYSENRKHARMDTLAHFDKSDAFQ